MINALTNEPGNFKVFGRQDMNRYWILRLSDVNSGSNSNIFKMLPGGSGSNIFGLDTYAGSPEYSNEASWPVVPLKATNPNKGKILNQLFGQTLCLWFNLKNNNELSTIAFGDNMIVADANCGSNVPIPGTQHTISFPHEIAVFLAGPNGYPNTIGGLFQLANDLLGGVNNTGMSLETALNHVQSSVEGINSGFDECRVLLGYAPYTTRITVTTPAEQPKVQPKMVPMKESTPKVTVDAFPNPFQEKVTFVVKSPIAGQGTLDVFSLGGSKLQTVYTGYISNSKPVTIEYNVPLIYRVNLVWVLRIGDQTVTGKLLNIR
jgi:hypothetical protein